MDRYSRIIIAACLLIAMTVGLSFAQATTGTIGGTVTDQTGAVIAGAMVTVRNVDTNITRTGSSNEIGRFTFPALPIGNYEVTIEQGGFGKVVRGPVVLTLNQTAVVDAELKPAGVTTEIVTVGDDARQSSIPPMRRSASALTNSDSPTCRLRATRVTAAAVSATCSVSVSRRLA
jgi:hypothetical protein